MCVEWEKKHPVGSPIDYLTGTWDDGTPIPTGSTAGSPEGCTGPLEDSYRKTLRCFELKKNIPAALEREKPLTRLEATFEKLTDGGSETLKKEYAETCIPPPADGSAVVPVVK